MMSMTGYGSYSLEIDRTTVTVEIRSVNHRFLDIHTKMPHSFLQLEDKIKKIVQSFFSRGRIDVLIRLDGEGHVSRTLQTDWGLMDQYIREINKAKERYQLEGEIPIAMLTSFPDLFSIHEADNDSSDLQNAVLETVEKACGQVQSMRREEGEFLHNDLNKRIDDLYKLAGRLQSRRSVVIKEYRKRIRERLDEYLDDTVTIDEARIAQEIALLAEKGDITEEITRLFSHIEHMKELLESKSPIGRKMDFIVQEMHREANTIGSKSTDVKIGEWTVALKSEIEKLKEQIQNIE